MRRHTVALSSLVIMLLLAFSGCSPEELAVVESGDIDDGEFAIDGAVAEFVPGEILIQYLPSASESQRGTTRTFIGAAVKEVIHTAPMKASGMGPIEIATLPPNGNVIAAVKMLNGTPGVDFAEPNYTYRHTDISNDPQYMSGNLWGMYGDGSPLQTNQYGSQAAEAWDRGNIGNSIVHVGVIDEGIDISHPDLKDIIWTNFADNDSDGIDDDGNGYIDDAHGWDFFGGDNSIYDGVTDDHGTHVSGTLGAKGGNGIGVAGVNWNVKIISAKFLGPNGGTTANAVKAVDYITDLKTRHGLSLVATNNSWGGGGFSLALLNAIKRANDAGILFVAAAGNNGRNTDRSPFYPAGYNADNVIAVAAINSAGGLASFSNYGKKSVDLGAPGVNIVSTVPGGDAINGAYASYSGTSMATPHVTGAIALLKASNSSTTAAELKARILDTASATPTASLNNRCVTSGRLNASSF